MSVKEIISIFGGQQAVADICGISQGAVSQWENHIPARHQPKLLRKAREDGIALDPIALIVIGAEIGASHTPHVAARQAKTSRKSGRRGKLS